MKNNIFIVGVLILLSACAPKNARMVGVSFNQPQPEGAVNLIDIPNFYHGYFYDKDSNKLKIEKKYMTLIFVDVIKISKQEADTTKDLKIEDQYIFIKSLNEKWPFTLKEDTLYVKRFYSDTLYNFKTDIIRKFRGYIILNKQYDDLWDVQIVSIKSGVLKIRKFTPEDIFEKLTKLSNAEVQTDKSKNILVKRFLKPTRKQFENLINYKDSLSVDVYKKIYLPKHSTN